MKRFRWPLQRLLDVTELRARALRGELLALAQQIAAARGDLFVRQTSLQAALAEFGRLAFEQRLQRHEVFMRCSAAQQAQLRRLRGQLDELLDRQKAKTQELAAAKASQQTLERLRGEALARYQRELDAAEQKQLDESSQVAFVRGRRGAAGERAATGA